MPYPISVHFYGLTCCSMTLVVPFQNQCKSWHNPKDQNMRQTYLLENSVTKFEKSINTFFHMIQFNSNYIFNRTFRTE